MTGPGSPELIRAASLLLLLGPRSQRWAEWQTESGGGANGLTWRQVEAMRVVAALRTPTLGTVALEIDGTPAVVTGLADRLVRQDLLLRVRDRGDARVIRVMLTAAGVEALTSVDGLLQEKLARSIATLTAADQSSLLAALQLLEAIDDDRCPSCDFPMRREDDYCAQCGEALRR
ncbi:MAG: MarR family winged helix-turn-helix transcriptional regulator [Thermomicrobiales bacterium]